MVNNRGSMKLSTILLMADMWDEVLVLRVPVDRVSSMRGVVIIMAKNDELMKLIGNETDPHKIAEIVANYTLQQKRKRDVAAERREWFGNIINNIRKVSPATMDALVYEYAMANRNDVNFSMWLLEKHPQMFKAPEKKKVEIREY